MAARCKQYGLAANIEIKPTTGQETLTGRIVAQAAAQLWRDHPIEPLLSSFSIEALAAAQQAVPALPSGLLLDEWEED